MKRVGVMGHRGMLGHVVARYLGELGYEVLTRDERFRDERELNDYVEACCAAGADWWVNCIGVRRPQVASLAELEQINHHLPALCSKRLPRASGFIHASTDGVFLPDAGACDWDRPTDAKDPYGRSKRRAEASLTREQDWVIRTSIVGPELGGPPRSLLGWLMQAPSPVKGFRNQSWNGTTTLQWAKECARVMEGRVDVKGRVVQLSTHPVISKGELLRLLAQAWQLPCEVSLVDAEDSVNRYLVGNVRPSQLSELLAEMKAWY